MASAASKKEDQETPVMPFVHKDVYALARHQQLLTGGGAYGFVKKMLNMQCLMLYLICFREAGEHQMTRPFPLR